MCNHVCSGQSTYRGGVQKMLAIIEYGVGRENGGAHRGEPSAPVEDFHRARKQAFTCHRTAIEAGNVLDIWVLLTRAKSHAYQPRIEPVYIEYDNGERGVDRNFRLCNKSGESGKKL